MSKSSLVELVLSERFKLWFAAFLATQITAWIGYFAAWGSIPLLSDMTVSSGLATFIASVVASAGVSIFVIILTRVDRVLNLLAEIADAQVGNSKIEGIVLKSDAEAANHPSPLVVGPSAVNTTPST